MLKLFVLIRKDLSPSQQAVQAGHVVAEYLLHSQPSWKNEILVYLGVKNLSQLEKYKYLFSQEGIKFVEFREPDLNNEPTAIATDIENKYVQKLNLI
jgi:hypothetical protein